MGERPERTIAYPPDAVLTAPEVAAWLGVSVRTVQRLPLKRIEVAAGRTRYLARHVYEWLERKAA